MKITPEMMGKFENCKSAEEVLELAKQEKFSMTMEQSQKVFDLLQSEDMTEEMMEKVVGGRSYHFERALCWTPEDIVSKGSI